MIKKTLLLLFTCALFFTACEDDPTELTDTVQPTFAIDQPTSNETYRSGEPIQVAVELADDNELAQYKVVVRNLATDELVFIESQTTEEKSVEVTGQFTVSVAESTDFRLEIEIEDAAGNETSDTRTFSVLPPPGGVLNLNMKLTYQDEPLVMFERYNYEAMRVFFTRFSTYLSNIALTVGDEETLIKEVDFLILSDAHETAADAANGFDYQIGGIPAGNYDGLKFAIGVDAANNALTPASFPPSSSLSKSGEYWASWESYIFQKTEAKLDSDGDDEFETQVALHLGSDNAYRQKQLARNINIRVDEITTINITIDVYDMLVQNNEPYDLKEDHQIHSLSQIPLIEQLADNLVVAIQ